MILGLLYVKRDSFKFLFNNIVWGIFVIGIVCYFISGQTWNLINGPPFMPQHKNAVVNTAQRGDGASHFVVIATISVVVDGLTLVFVCSYFDVVHVRK
ncbi:unnamed protein product [Rotaria sp. Silwood1]|nr:unnamed protein product [Rotaria sp. Silwood1]